MTLKDRNNKRFMREGKIKLGYKAWSCRKCKVGKIPISDKCPKCGAAMAGHDYPVELPYFVIPEDMQEHLGVKPTALEILLPMPHPDDNFDMSYIVWGSNSGAMCVGDGENVSYAVPMKEINEAIHRAPGTPLVAGGHAVKDFAFGEHSFKRGDTVPCPGKEKGLYPQCKACNRSGYLRIIFADPDLYHYKFWQIDTRSGRNYDTIRTALYSLYSEIEGLTGQGFVNGIKCRLERVKEISYPIDERTGMPMKVENCFLHLTPDPDFMRGLYERKCTMVLSSPSQSVKLLESGEQHYADFEPDSPPWQDGEIEEPPASDKKEPEKLKEEEKEVVAFQSPGAAIAWGFDQGCFKSKAEAQTAYEELKAAKTPGDAVEMAKLWRDAVANRIDGKATVDPRTNVEAHYIEMVNRAHKVGIDTDYPDPSWSIDELHDKLAQLSANVLLAEQAEHF